MGLKTFTKGQKVMYAGDEFTYIRHDSQLEYFVDICRVSSGVRKLVHEYYVTPLEEKVAVTNTDFERPKIQPRFTKGDRVTYPTQKYGVGTVDRVERMADNKLRVWVDWDGHKDWGIVWSDSDKLQLSTENELSDTPIADQEKSIEEELIEYLGGIVKSAETRIEKATSTIAAATRELGSASARRSAANNIIIDLRERNQ